MPVTVPAWFKGRQGKAEEAGPGVLRLNGPNLKEWFVGIRRQPTGTWTGFLRESADGPDVVVQDFERQMPEYEAWEAVFELYRNVVII